MLVFIVVSEAMKSTNNSSYSIPTHIRHEFTNGLRLLQFFAVRVKWNANTQVIVV